MIQDHSDHGASKEPTNSSGQAMLCKMRIQTQARLESRLCVDRLPVDD